MESPTNPSGVPSSFAQERVRETSIPYVFRPWELPALLGCLILALLLFALAVSASPHPGWLYRNPWIAFGWRFAAFYGVMAAIRFVYYGSAPQESSRKAAWAKGRSLFFIILIGVSVHAWARCPCHGFFHFGAVRSIQRDEIAV